MSVVDEVKSRLDIVEIVSEYVALQKTGGNYKAKCPFHVEKTPSFVVNPERQTWHCFGACSTGGNAFDFVIRREGISFGDALKLLADRTGVVLRPARAGSSERYEALYRINQEAADFYEKTLMAGDGSKAMAYLAERGVDGDVKTSFKLGMSPLGRDKLKNHLRSMGFDLEHAVETGLLRKGGDGSIRDFFWGRLMFPIFDRRGRVVGFGGRSLDGSEPKYINTAATRIFDKQAILYGLHLAMKPIRDSDTAVVVEGYMDVIAAHQFGFTNVVASMGTALTRKQVNLLRSTAKTFILALDPDLAGQEATQRSLRDTENALRGSVGSRHRAVGQIYTLPRLDLAIAPLPVGQDPDALIRRNPDEWERLISEPKPYVEFMIRAIPTHYDLTQPQGKAEAAEALAPIISSVVTAIEQEHYFQLASDELGVSRQVLEATIGRPIAPDNTRQRGKKSDMAPGRSPSPVAQAGRDRLEEYILVLLLQRPELKDLAKDTAPEQFHGIENRELFTSWQSCSTIDELRAGLDTSLYDHLEYLSKSDHGPGGREEDVLALKEAIRRLQQRHLKELQESILVSGDPTLPPSKDLEEPITSVNTKLKNLFQDSVQSSL